MRGAWWYIVGAVVVAAGVIVVIAQPKLFLVAIAAIVVVAGYIAIPKNLAIGISVISSFLVIAALPAGTLSSIPYGNTLVGVITNVLVLAGVAKSARRLRWPRFMALLIAYSLILLLGSFGNNPDAFYVLGAIYGVAVYWAASNTNAREAAIIRVGIIILGGVEALLAIYEAFSHNGPLLGQAITIDSQNPFFSGLTRAQGTLGHPLVLSLLLLVGLGLVLIRGNLSARWRLVLAPLFAVAILLTGSTSAILAAVVLIIYWFLMRRSWAGSTIAVLVGVFAVIVFVQRGGTDLLLGDEVTGRAASHRLNSIGAIPSLIGDRDVLHSFLGSGLGSAGQLYQTGILYNDGFNAIDNQFVTALSQTGTIGLALFIAFVACILFRGKRQYAAVVIGFIIMAFSFDFLSWYLAAGMFFAIAAISVGPRDRLIEPEALELSAQENSRSASGPKDAVAGSRYGSWQRT